MPSSESRNSTDERAASIALLLNRLALHCPVRNLPAHQAALLMQETITDLLPYNPQQVAEACTEWRRGETPFFPTSGQIIGLIRAASERSIASARASKPAYRTPKLLEAPRNGAAKPWRQILAEHRRAVSEPSDAIPACPAQQETLLQDGSLPELRRAELCALNENLRKRVSA